MKKFLTITLLVLLTVGLFVACNANAVETVFDTSYKVQSDGSWKMGGKVYEPSTKPYILVLPKTLNVEKDVQLEDLEAGMKTLDEIRSATTKTDIGNATVELKHDDFGSEYYEYINNGDESKAQNIFMRTTDNDFTETILLKAPYDEFSHYGSLNVATLDEIDQNSYYEYGRVKKVVLKIGHLVAKAPSQIDVIIVNTNDTTKVSVDVETTNVKGIVAPEGVTITKPASVVAAKTEEAKFMDEDGTFYKTFTDITGDKVTLLDDVTEALTIDKNIEIDMFGNEISGTITISAGKTVTFTDSVGDGSLDKEPNGDGTFKVKNGNYGFDPKEYLADKEGTEGKAIEGTNYYKVAKKTDSPTPETQHKGICFTAEEAGATVALKKVGNPNAINLVYSTDGVNFQDYTIGDPISASKVGDKVYFKAKTNNGSFAKYTDKGGDQATVEYYQFVIPNTMSCEGNVMYLLDSTGAREDVPEYAFTYLFYGCNKLTSAPVLPATELSQSCYLGMFVFCTALVNAPELSATTLAVDCYDSMFYGCTSLKNAPELPATTLTDLCYYQMFSGCTSLETAPALPATNLAKECYCFMFEGCTSLKNAPELPATTLVSNCYSNMFNGCTSLNSVTMLATDVSATDCLKNWLKGTAEVGTLYAHSTMVKTFNDNKSTYYIPSGWNAKLQVLCFTAVEDGAAVMLRKNGNPYAAEIIYSTDGINYKDYTFGTVISAPNVGDKVYFRAKAKNENFSKNGGNFYQFNILNGKKMSCEGNVMYLLDSTGERMDVPANAFNGLFYYSCYYLTSAPSLPATTLADYCYFKMFENCANLETAPELPAPTLANYCYSAMFQSCKKLTDAPLLQAATLTTGCYDSMFAGCTSLQSVTMLATENIDLCIDQWLSNVSTTGTLTVANDTVKSKIQNNYGPQDAYGDSLVNNGWTVDIYSPSNLIPIIRDISL